MQSIILKTIGFIVVFILSVLFYLLYTPSGQIRSFGYVSYYLSQKANVDVKLKSLNLHQYPYIISELMIEDKYTLKIDGYIQDLSLKLKYTLTSQCLESKVCNIKDDVLIKGKIIGALGDVHITGAGKILEGEVTYHWNKQDEEYRDISLLFNDINASKLAKLLGEEALVKGVADVNVTFDIINENHKEGSIFYDVKESNLSGLVIDLHTKIFIIDEKHTFKMDINTTGLTLAISKGSYDQKEKYAHAFYSLNIEDLSQFETLIGQKIGGDFYAFGEIEYDKKLIIKGLSKSMGGFIELSYADETLLLDLENIPLQNLMQRLSLDRVMSASTLGQIKYDFLEKKLTSEIKFQNLHLLPSSLASLLSEKMDIDIEKETFGRSEANLTYHHNLLSGSLSLANAQHHILLTDAFFLPLKKHLKTHIDIKTGHNTLEGELSLKLDNYTSDKEMTDSYITFEGMVKKYYALTLDGMINQKWLNMDYTLKAHRLPSHLCTIEDEVNLSGHLNGPFKRLHLNGHGTMLDGEVEIESVKIDDSLENTTLSLKNIHAQKLFTLLGHPDLPHGRSDINASFSLLNKENQKGNLTYRLKRGLYEGLALDVTNHTKIENEKLFFDASILLDNAKIKLIKGKYNSESNITSAFYTLDVTNLSPFESLLGYAYQGDLYAMGEIHYDKQLKLTGLSKSYGGFLDFTYFNDKLLIDLDKVSFQAFMHLFPYPILLDAQTTGKILYEFPISTLTVDTKLNQAHFLPSEIVDTVYQKSSVDMKKEVFNNSTLKLTYANDVILGEVKLANPTSYFYLTNAKINTIQNTIDAYFDFKMQEQNFTGKIYGALDAPKVNLNMQKLIKYQMDKQLDSLVGKDNRELMESMPMGGVAKEMSTEVAASFMGIFF